MQHLSRGHRRDIPPPLFLYRAERKRPSGHRKIPLFVLPVMPDVLDIVVLGALPPVGANKNPWKIKRFQTFAFPKLLVPFFMYVTTLVTR